MPGSARIPAARQLALAPSTTARRPRPPASHLPSCTPGDGPYPAEPPTSTSRRDALLMGGSASLSAAAAALAAPTARADAQQTTSPGPLINTKPKRLDQLERELESRVTRFQLANGMRFVVVRRPVAPVVSVNTYCAAGAWVEDDGQTGIAHLLEHLAFKGTPRIGSRDWKREAGLLDSLDEGGSLISWVEEEEVETRGKSAGCSQQRHAIQPIHTHTHTQPSTLCATPSGGARAARPSRASSRSLTPSRRRRWGWWCPTRLRRCGESKPAAALSTHAPAFPLVIQGASPATPS
jgi:hypothetical protein